MEMPDGYYAEIRPRSGLAVKHGIDTLAGVIDSDYRGEVKVVLINHHQEDFTVSAGDRIAQLVFRKHEAPNIMLVDELGDSVRGAGGFGSTGV
jgi:dUTP pyrophosphatase